MRAQHCFDSRRYTRQCRYVRGPADAWSITKSPLRGGGRFGLRFMAIVGQMLTKLGDGASVFAEDDSPRPSGLISQLRCWSGLTFRTMGRLLRRLRTAGHPEPQYRNGDNDGIASIRPKAKYGDRSVAGTGQTRLGDDEQSGLIVDMGDRRTETRDLRDPPLFDFMRPDPFHLPVHSLSIPFHSIPFHFRLPPFHSLPSFHSVPQNIATLSSNQTPR